MREYFLPDSDPLLNTKKRKPRFNTSRELSLAIFSTLAAFAFMFLLHLVVSSLSYNDRIPAFIGFAALYLFWPIVAKVVPVQYLFAVTCFPIFGIWLGMRYTSDIGPDSYMFAAQPDCFSGLWGVVVTAIISWSRLR